MLKLLTTLFFVATILNARASFTIMPYHTYAKFSNDSVKKEGYAVGLYASLYNYPHKFEFDSEYINIKFKNSIPEYSENDLTFVYSYFLQNNFLIKGGMHFVSSDNILSNEGLSAIMAGVEYNTKKNILGLESYYSEYSKYKPKKLQVFQLHPYLMHNFINSSKFGSLSFGLDFNYIKPKNANIYYDLQNSYNSIGLKAVYKKNRLTTTLEAWKGKRAFALEDGGFTLYNFSQLYTSAFSASVAYEMKEKSHIKLKYAHHNYINNGKEGSCNSVTTSLLHTW